MIMKYDKMIEITQAESRRKMEVAKKAISAVPVQQFQDLVF